MRIQYRLYDLAHRVIQAAWRVHLQNDHDRIVCLGAVDTACDQFLGDRPDGPVDLDQVGLVAGCCDGPCAPKQHEQGEPENRTEKLVFGLHSESGPVNLPVNGMYAQYRHKTTAVEPRAAGRVSHRQYQH